MNDYVYSVEYFGAHRRLLSLNRQVAEKLAENPSRTDMNALFYKASELENKIKNLYVVSDNYDRVLMVLGIEKEKEVMKFFRIPHCNNIENTKTSRSTSFYLEDAGFHICNVPKEWNDWNLFHIFQSFGKVGYCRVAGQTNDSQAQLGFVSMMSVEEADEVRRNLNDGNLVGEDYTLKVSDHENISGAFFPKDSVTDERLLSSPPAKKGPVLLSSSWLPLNKEIEVEVVDHLPSSSVSEDFFALTVLRVNDSSMTEKYDSLHEKMNSDAQLVPFDSELPIGYDGVFRESPRSIVRVRRISATKLYLVDFGRIVNYEKSNTFQLPKVFQTTPTRVSLGQFDVRMIDPTEPSCSTLVAFVRAFRTSHVVFKCLMCRFTNEKCVLLLYGGLKIVEKLLGLSAEVVKKEQNDWESKMIFHVTGDADNHEHKLIENQTDGKLVEVQRDTNASMDEKGGKDEKLERIKREYTLILTSQLEDQRKYFEGQRLDMEQTMSEMEKMAYAQVESLEHQLADRSTEVKTLKGEVDECLAARRAAEKKSTQTTEKITKLANDLKDERELNEMLRKDQQVWKEQVDKLNKRQESAQTDYEKRIADLQSQANELLMRFETQNKLKEQIEVGTVTQEETVESQLGLDDSAQTSKKTQRRKKNN